MKRRLLWIGDAGCSSGYERGTRYSCEGLRPSFDLSVLAIGYTGDPHTYPYDLYPAYGGGDVFGFGRVSYLVQKLGVQAIVVQQDPWNFQQYMQLAGNVPVIGVVAVDGKNCQGSQLNGLKHAIFWTKFGEAEAKLGGYTGPSSVIPLGVDLDIYKPLNQQEMRDRINFTQICANHGLPPDTFVVGVVGRNQTRKRLDLTLQYFSEWVHSRNIPNAMLWLHVAPTGDAAFDLNAIAKYYGIADRIFTPQINPIHGLPEKSMTRIYNIFDCVFTTTLGEGWGLPIIEAMACGIPTITPKWSGLGEWAESASISVPCDSTAITPGINTVGGIMNRQDAISALDRVYRSRDVREDLRERGLALTAQPRYRWSNIGNAVRLTVEQALFPEDAPISEAIWHDLGQPETSVTV